MTPVTRAERWRRFWQPPDAVLLEAGASGELFTARVRLALTATLTAIPALTLATEGLAARENLVSLTVASFAMLLAAIVLLLISREASRVWLSTFTALLDVSLVSLVLAMYLLLGRPDIAVNSYVVYPCYFLAIGATTLRYDARTCVAAGLVAIVEYFTIALIAASGWDLNGPLFEHREYGAFAWSTQASRLVLLGAATVIATASVARTQQWLRQSASDSLTGLHNRRFFDDRVEEEFLRAKRYNRPLAIAMIDIDHFKQFNDSYGHAAGDDVLRLVAEKISHGLRRTDVVARYGGEELAAILPETDRASAAQKAELLRIAVQEATVAVRRAHGPVGVTISVGVASWPDDGNSVTEILETADARLYSAKQKGRNRVSGAVVRRLA